MKHTQASLLTLVLILSLGAVSLAQKPKEAHRVPSTSESIEADLDPAVSHPASLRLNPKKGTFQESIGGGDDTDLGFCWAQHGHQAYLDSIYAVWDTIDVGLRCDPNPFSAFVLADTSYWRAIEEVYANFDSLNVNPYDTDTSSIDEFACMQLYDELAGRAWAMPTKQTYITSPFKQRHSRWHYGTDLKIEIGDSITSVFDGVVRVSKYNRGGYGNYIIVRHHNGLESLYGHLSRRDVCVGQPVKAGELIGLGGNTGRSTGPHLHFELRWKGIAFDTERLFDYDVHTLSADCFELSPEVFSYYKELERAAYHRVRSGDTLGAIARRYGTSVTAICRLNGIRSSKILRIGETLRVR